MNMEDILNSGANVTLTIKSTDLKEFAEHLVKKDSERYQGLFHQTGRGLLDH